MGAAAAWAAVAVSATSAYVSHKQAAEAQDRQTQAEQDAAANRPQASKAPGVQAVQADQLGTGQAGGSPGVAQTFLTGASGVDPSLLNLGKNTLLGGGG
jgi:hypothetical protein